MPSLIAMDLKLPDNMGAEGAATLKKHFPNAHLIVLSGAPAAELEVPCIEADADVYIQKSAGATANSRTKCNTSRKTRLSDCHSSGPAY